MIILTQLSFDFGKQFVLPRPSRIWPPSPSGLPLFCKQLIASNRNTLLQTSTTHNKSFRERAYQRCHSDTVEFPLEFFLCDCEGIDACLVLEEDLVLPHDHNSTRQVEETAHHPRHTTNRACSSFISHY